MKIQTTFFTSLRQGASLASLAVLGLIIMSGRATAQIETMNNGGSVATVDLGSSAGMDYWSVNGVGGQSQLNQQWFWYSLSGQTGASSIDSIGLTSHNLSADQSTLTATYSDPTLAVGITYQLQGSGVGSDAADLYETINIANNSSSPLSLDFYQYSNFNLLQNNQNTINVFGSPGAYTSIVQNTMVGGNGIEETIDTPFANYAEAGLAGSVSGDVAAGNTLNGTLVAGPGNVGWAFEWVETIGVGDSVTIYKDKDLSISPVPEPGIAGLMALGLGALGFIRRKVS